MKEKYIEPSIEVIAFGDNVFTNNLTVSGGSFEPTENQDEWYYL